MRQKIPWFIGVCPEAYVEYCGETMSRYHGDPAVMMEVQLRGPEILHEKYGLPLRTSVAPDFTTYITGSVFGLEFEVFEDGIPSYKGHPIHSIEEAAALTCPEDISQAGYFPQALEFYAYMKAHAREGVTVSFSGGHQAPFTTALLLRGHGFLLDVIDRPDLAHRFLQTLTEAALKGRELARRINGDTSAVESIAYSDDYGGLLSPHLYYDFDVQYLLQMARHFGATRLSLHSELLRQPHLRILQDAGFSFIDVGTDPYLTISQCREVLHIPFQVDFDNIGVLMFGTPAQVRQRYLDMLAEGAERMHVDICRGIPEDNVHAFLEVARENE